MLDPRAHRDNAASSFRAHDGRQPGPIAIAAGDHQKIVLVYRRRFDRNHDFAGRRGANLGDIEGFGDLCRIAERLDLNCLHDQLSSFRLSGFFTTSLAPETPIALYVGSYRLRLRFSYLPKLSPNMGKPLFDSSFVASSSITSQCSARRPSLIRRMSAAIQFTG